MNNFIKYSHSVYCEWNVVDVYVVAIPCIYRGDSVRLYREILYIWRVCARGRAGDPLKKNPAVSALELLSGHDILLM